MKISVIMAVSLARYENAITSSASHPEYRFIQAVKSFLAQSFKDAELIIVSDGDKMAEDIWAHQWVANPSIKFKYIAKQSQFSGVVRNTGLAMAEGDIVCYLDHDDGFGPTHLKVINDNFDIAKYDWVYYNDFLVDTIMAEKYERQVITAPRSIGTSSIAHKRSTEVVWGDEYNHDYHMIEKYLLHLPHTKIPTPEYYVCHFRKIEDFK